jgi:branched-chain amino acid transport system substrate-binding protein
MRAVLRGRVTALLVTSILIAGCGSSSSSSGGSAGSGANSTPTATAAASASGGGQSGSPIVIGAAIAKTGLLSAYDIPAWTAFQMEIASVNAGGGVNGHQIKLISADTKSVIPNGAVVAKQLLGQGAQMLVVSCDYDFGSPAAGAAQEAGKVSMSLCAQSPLFGVQGIGDKAYTVSEDVVTEGAVVATFARKQKNLKNTFLLVDDTLQYDRGLCDGYKKAFTALGGKIAGQANWSGKDPSIAAEITQFQSSGADSLMLCSFPPDGSGALRQLTAAGVKVPILSGGGMDGTYWVSAVPHISNFFITTQVSVFGNDADPAVNAFVKAYAKQTGKPPVTAYAAVGYSAAQALVAALQGTGGDASGDAVAAKLDSFNKQQLLIGPTTFSATDHIPVDRPMVVIQYTDGKPHFLTRQAPGVTIAVTDS